MTAERVKVELKPAQEIGTCSLCVDRPAEQLVYRVTGADPTSPLRICEPCMVAMFNASSVASRQGTPLDKLGMYSWPLRAPGDDGEVRHAVVTVFYPPVELRDAPREVIEMVVMGRKKQLLSAIVDEIFRGYVSEPATPAAARNIADALNRHADAAGKG